MQNEVLVFRFHRQWVPLTSTSKTSDKLGSSLFSFYGLVSNVISRAFQGQSQLSGLISITPYKTDFRSQAILVSIVYRPYHLITLRCAVFTLHPLFLVLINIFKWFVLLQIVFHLINIFVFILFEA